MPCELERLFARVRAVGVDEQELGVGADRLARAQRTRSGSSAAADQTFILTRAAPT